MKVNTDEFNCGSKHYHVALTASDAVEACPFCGGRPELRNTWTASYWVECACGAEIHSDNLPMSCTEKEAGGTRAEHLRSARNAVAKWNTRTPLAAAAKVA